MKTESTVQSKDTTFCVQCKSHTNKPSSLCNVSGDYIHRKSNGDGSCKTFKRK